MYNFKTLTKLKPMRNFVFLLIGIVTLYSCSNSNFAKRRYTKGVYIEKRTVAKSGKKIKAETKYQTSNSKNPKKENPSHSEKSKHEQEVIVEEEIVEPTDDKIDEIIDQETETIPNSVNAVNKTNSPPEKNDGEELTRSKTDDSLTKISMITGFTALGLFSIASIFAIVLFFIAVSAGSVATPYIIGLWILYGISYVVALVALITGSIAYNKTRNKKARIGIIIGAILVGIALLTLLAVLIP